MVKPDTLACSLIYGRLSQFVSNMCDVMEV